MTRALFTFSAVVAVALLLTVPGTAQVAGQSVYQDGYQFGLGLHTGQPFFAHRFARGGFPHSFQRFETPPYFAQFPPVYYSADLVRRPYGVSPFAAPPGIVPVEMMLRPSNPVRVVNPYVEPVDAEPLPQHAPREVPSAAPADDNRDGWRLPDDSKET